MYQIQKYVTFAPTFNQHKHMKKEVTLAQSNALTQAKYDFTVVEKRAVYYIIKEVRSRFIERQDGQKDLFNDFIVSIKTADLQGSDTVLRDIYLALKSLRRKSIWIEDKTRVLEVGYINYFEHVKQQHFLTVQVSHKILPYLVELAERFTTYSLTVAIALKTKYSQRFYEYCCQYKNIGYFYVSIDELRTKLMVGDAYPRYALLKKRVIEVACNELKELFDKDQCDICFNYSEDKAGRTVLGIRVALITKGGKDALKIDDYIFYIKAWLSTWLNVRKSPKNKEWVDNVISHLQQKPEKINKLYLRLKKLQVDEPDKNCAALARHIIEEDYLN